MKSHRSTHFILLFSFLSFGFPSTQGTRVGIFPLPSNLDIANLHAVLIVHKVVSDDTDLEPYVATPAATTKQKNPLERLQSRAQKAANKLGLFLSPFAFGVAPLLKAIGEEVPTSVPTSRAVQIPLFKLDPGKGEIPIFEHIINLRYPRSSSDGVNESTTTTCGCPRIFVGTESRGYLHRMFFTTSITLGIWNIVSAPSLTTMTSRTRVPERYSLHQS